ncbi:hypothetical protein BGX20_001971 [Mortierella sp. AD010]|nr:hypothetical protein BGX20_001971 [Mortierella sp. AD010]
MTSVATSQPISGPHVKVERSRVTSTRENSRSTNVVSPAPKSTTTLTQKPTNKRYSNVQSKVGSLEAINYKPKPSEKKIQSFKQDFSHVKSKVDAKLVAPARVAPAEDAADTAAPASDSSSSTSATAKAAAPAKRSPIVTIGTRNSSATGAGAKVLSPTSRAPSTASSTSAVNSGSNASTPKPTTGPTRRMSKHIIPTQKANYDNVKAKVGSFDNISYASRGRASSQSSSTDEGSGDAASPTNGRPGSPSAKSSTSSSGPSSPSRRSSFKIPPSKKVDYSKVRSKVGSLENLHHVPQGGNLRIFNEKLSFRDQAQSKIAKEINIAQFYDYSRENSIQEEGQEGEEGEEYNQSITHSSEVDDEFQPPKNILSVLDEMIESVDELDLEGQQQQQEQQPNDSHDAHVEPTAAM